MKATKLHRAIKKSALPAAMATALLGASSVQADNDMQSKEDTAYPDRTYVYQESKINAEEYWNEFKQDSQQTWNTSKEAFRDGWIEGKLETALILNEHLNPFEIDIAVDEYTATLSGQVGSSLDKELAENVALGIEGIDNVENQLEVSKDAEKSGNAETSKRAFSDYLVDVTTTAAIKTELLTSDNISGMDINVDTQKNVVYLRGEVDSSAEKELVGAIAARQDDVVKVVNQLEVKS